MINETIYAEVLIDFGTMKMFCLYYFREVGELINLFYCILRYIKTQIPSRTDIKQKSPVKNGHNERKITMLDCMN